MTNVGCRGDGDRTPRRSLPFCLTSRMQGPWKGKIADDPVRVLSAATFLEPTIVIEARLGDPEAASSICGYTGQRSKNSRWTPEQADMARRAWRRFGRGRHPVYAMMGFGPVNS
jgi:uncharacterized protein with PIN domain